MLAVAQPGEVSELAAGLVAARVIAQQVANRPQAGPERGEPLGRLFPHDAAERVS